MKPIKPTKKVFTRRVIEVSVAAIIVAFIILRMIHWDETMETINRVKQILSPVIVGIAIAYLLNFIYVKIYALEKKIVSHKKMSKFNNEKLLRAVGVFTTELLGIGIIVLLCIAIVPSLIDSIVKIVNQLPETVKTLQEVTDGFMENNKWTQGLIGKDTSEVFEKIQGYIIENAKVNSEFIREKTFDILSKTFTYSVNLIVSLIINVMILSSKDVMVPQAKKVILAVFGKEKNEIILRELRLTHEKFSGFIIGKIVDSVIIGVITYIVCKIIGIEYSGLVAIVVGTTNIVPLVGPFIGAIPSAVVVFSQSPKLTIYFAIFILIIQLVDGNIIGPKCVGNSTNLSSFWVLVSIIVFGKLFGMLGMIIGVPTFAVIYDIVKRVVNSKIAKIEHKTSRS